MALPSSGQISLHDVRTELGLSGQISLTDSAVRSLFAIASGQISLHDGYGKSYLQAAISSRTVNGGSIAGYQLTSGGAINVADISSGGSFNGVGTWKLSGNGSDFQVFASISSGSGVAGPLGTWVSLGSTQSWTLTAPTGVFNFCTISVSIRRAVDSVVLTSASIDLLADNR